MFVQSADLELYNFIVDAAGSRHTNLPAVNSAGPRPYIIPDQATQFGVAP